MKFTSEFQGFRASVPKKGAHSPHFPGHRTGSRGRQQITPVILAVRRPAVCEQSAASRFTLTLPSATAWKAERQSFLWVSAPVAGRSSGSVNTGMSAACAPRSMDFGDPPNILRSNPVSRFSRLPRKCFRAPFVCLVVYAYACMIRRAVGHEQMAATAN